MTIKELRDELIALDSSFDNVEIFLQVDAEGNGYNPLRGLDVNCSVDEDNDNEILSNEWGYDEASFEDQQEWDEFKKEHPAAVLFP